MKCYYEYLIDDIIKIIKDNLILQYNYNEYALTNIRKHCIEKSHKKYEHLDYDTTINFVEEVLDELINIPFFYDFRDID